MNKDKAIEKVSKLLTERKNKVIGKNIVSAALSLFTNPVDAVEKLFFGVEAETSDEKLKLQQDLLLELVCQIDDSLTKMQSQFNSKYIGEKSILIDGLIEVNSKNSENTTGVHIKSNSGQVEFKPGTKISIKAEGNSGNTIGLKIGD